MSQGIGTIRKTITNGPFHYVWEIDGEHQNAAINKTGIQAVDEIVALAKAIPGGIRKLTIIVDT